MSSISVDLILMLASKVLMKQPPGAYRDLPTELLMHISKDIASDRRPIENLKNFALSSRYMSLIAREDLWKKVSFVGEQRSVTRQWYSPSMRKYSFIRLINQRKVTPHVPDFITFIRYVHLVAASEDHSWMHDDVMLRILRNICNPGNLRGFELASSTWKMLDFSEFTQTVFPTLPDTLESLTIRNSCEFDPTIFNKLTALHTLELDGVFLKDIRIEAKSILIDMGHESDSKINWIVIDKDMVDPTSISKPKLRRFVYARSCRAANGYNGPPQERILRYLDLSGLTHAQFRFEHEDDYATLHAIMVACKSTLEDLALELAFLSVQLTEDWAKPWVSRFKNAASYLTLKRLSLKVCPAFNAVPNGDGLKCLVTTLNVFQGAKAPVLDILVICKMATGARTVVNGDWSLLDQAIIEYATSRWFNTALYFRIECLPRRHTGHLSDIVRPNLNDLLPLCFSTSKVIPYPLAFFIN